MHDKRTLFFRILILIGVFFNPLICFEIAKLFGGDSSDLNAVAILITGIAGLVLGAIVGPAQSHFVKSESKPYRSLAGYFVPALLVFAYTIYYVFIKRF